MHTSLIAQVLQSIGFKTVICSQGIIVSLNRKISSMEVETALAQEFDVLADSFNVIQINSSEVLVKE